MINVTNKTVIDWKGDRCVIIDTKNTKHARSKGYNFDFDNRTGLFLRWGQTAQEDPVFSPFGPEIVDIEISTNGCPNGCKFCYKGNTDASPTNMCLETFETIIQRIGPTLTQVALGITGTQTNLDFVPIMKCCRDNGVVPNVTVSGIDLTDYIANRISELCGAVAVSAYQTDKNVCYNAVQQFTNRGMKQCNIHLMVAAETMDFVWEVVNDRLTDERLKKLQAIVFLGVKPKGRAKGQFNPASMDDYKKLVNFCLEKNIGLGFDSCSSVAFENVIKSTDMPENHKKNMLMMAEPCESALFSFYINTKGEAWFCSFSENEPNVEPVNVLKHRDFLKDVWYAPQTIAFRNKVIEARNNRVPCHIHKVAGDTR